MLHQTPHNTVQKLFITHSDTKKTRESVSKIFVDEFGIKDDKFYNKNVMRAILLTATESYELAKHEGIDIELGSLGENILIDINPYSLVQGDKIRIGKALLEITQNCTLCQGLTAVSPKLPKLLKNDRGIFAKVVQGNFEIQLGDKVEILKH